jgi:hypothetical protein
MAENEVVFRQYNESIQRGLDDLETVAAEDGQETHIDAGDMPLHFYCECSDENCKQRVILRPSDYNEIHKRRDCFVLVCGHEMPEVERVIRKGDGYCVTQKYLPPPKSADQLRPTPTSNV